MREQILHNRPKVWGGIECTINRIGDEYKDQLKYSGHYDRPGDIEDIAELGIKTIRYPVLWEKHQPKRNAEIDWRWTDRQLETLRVLEIKPIVGLVHHGSGPLFTSLLDPEFPYLLSAYAYEVANRYPWIEDYTPVNEPLTTARFSGLYGLWYPHHNNELSFYRMLLNQLKGTVMSMEAIRSVNPSARLAQTEDLGKTFSTPLLAYQANFENDRRLLTFDILAGRLKPGHPQYEYMIGCGIREEEINFFQLHRIIPDVLGLNYYVTSERWLDESLEKYAHHTHGGNGVHQYADTELVRAEVSIDRGFRNLATEIWSRYRIPMAVTEVHLHCTREEQLRWFKEIWDDAEYLTNHGINIQGVTAWAMLGSFDWDTLLTKTGTQYESGVFDIKTYDDRLRPTALATLIKSLTTCESELHPVLSAPGWWHDSASMEKVSEKPILIIKNGSESPAGEFTKMEELFQYACSQRRIRNIQIDKKDAISIGELNSWAVIGLANTEIKVQSICQQSHMQRICLYSDERDVSCLKIVLEQTPITIHQVNKVLDLMIDGDEGCWIFCSDEVMFKTRAEIRSRLGHT